MPTSKPRFKPDDDDDDGAMWRDHHAARQVKRGENRKASTALLSTRGVSFETRNNGAHIIIVDDDSLRVDFWPGTGKFVVQRPTRLEGRGVFKLIQALGQLKYPLLQPTTNTVKE